MPAWRRIPAAPPRGPFRALEGQQLGAIRGLRAPKPRRQREQSQTAVLEARLAIIDESV
jgi:hypothetical protein